MLRALNIGLLALLCSAPARASESLVVRDAQALTAALADASGPKQLRLAAGVYSGNFRVQRTLELTGEAGTILDGTGHGTVLTIEANDVRIENLTVRHSGRRNTVEDAGVRAKGERIHIAGVRVEDSLFGITLGPCDGCTLEHSQVHGPREHGALQGDGIKLWESNHAVVRDCVVENMRDLVVWYSRSVVLERNLVRNSRYGAHFMYAHDSVVRDSRIVDNVVGVFVMYSSRLHVSGNVLAGAKGPAGVGIGFKDSDGVEVRNNWLVANTTGTYLDITPRAGARLATFEDNVFALNQVAVRFHSLASDMLFSDNEFRNNGSLLDVEGGGNALAATFAHNYYSDYAGYDLDHDGFGDVAHQVKQLSGALIDAHPSLALFEGTAAMRLLDVIAAAAPVFANKLLLSDPSPRFQPRGTP
ncbi:MAG TPA: nitrous oxide reductase family maturation protein NosD [Polyangiales bacterium]|nr:nitrous oxide reductase family maturation protein NosD [Polyangiales bacterium]